MTNSVCSSLTKIDWSNVPKGILLSVMIYRVFEPFSVINLVGVKESRIGFKYDPED